MAILAGACASRSPTDDRTSTGRASPHRRIPDLSRQSRRAPWTVWVALLATTALPLAALAAPTATPPKPTAKPAIKPATGGPASAKPAAATPAPRPAENRAPAAGPRGDVALDAIAAMVN